MRVSASRRFWGRSRRSAGLGAIAVVPVLAAAAVACGVWTAPSARADSPAIGGAALATAGTACLRTRPRCPRSTLGPGLSPTSTPATCSPPTTRTAATPRRARSRSPHRPDHDPQLDPRQPCSSPPPTPRSTGPASASCPDTYPSRPSCRACSWCRATTRRSRSIPDRGHRRDHRRDERQGRRAAGLRHDRRAGRRARRGRAELQRLRPRPARPRGARAAVVPGRRGHRAGAVHRRWRPCLP